MGCDLVLKQCLKAQAKDSMGRAQIVPKKCCDNRKLAGGGGQEEVTGIRLARWPRGGDNLNLNTEQGLEQAEAVEWQGNHEQGDHLPASHAACAAR